MIFTYRGYFGFDISTYQDAPTISGNVDFHKMRDYGASFVIIKAGQGDWRDPDFLTSWHNAKGILPRASYWYYDNSFDPKVQARKYWDIIKIDPEGICWIDLEDRQGGDFWDWKHWYDFIEEFKLVSQLPYERIGIYTNYYYWQESTRMATTAHLSYFAKFRLWLAGYGEKNSDPLHPNYALLMCPAPWIVCDILQSGTPVIGLAAGVESLEIDYDQLNGGDAEFERIFGIIPQQPEQPPTEGNITMSRYEAANTYGMSIRSTHAVTQYPTPLGYVPANSKIHGDTLWEAPNERWLQVTDVNGLPPKDAAGNVIGVPCWVAIVAAGRTYCTLTDTQPVEPPTQPPALPNVVWIGTTKDNVQEYRKAA
jgi:hypothetical protein